MWRKDCKEDLYTKKAQKEGYPARSVYKFSEMDAKFHLAKKRDSILDLGASPGSWFLYLARKVGNKGFVLGVDKEPLKIEVLPNAVFVKKDVTELTCSQVLSYKKSYDVVVSDMAPSTTGIRKLDSLASLELCYVALELAKAVLKNKGSFVCKVFEGEDSPGFVKAVRELFGTLKIVKPRATKKESSEFYVVAKEYRKKD